MASLIIGTRGSTLALWQANYVSQKLKNAIPDLEISLKIIKTTGDKITDVPLAKIGGKGLFVKEIEEALLAKKVDLAVHSLKDVPAQLPPSLSLCTILSREDPSDALLIRKNLSQEFQSLPEGASIGTTSLRRQVQVKAARPDIMIKPLRGNVDTRLKKLEEGNFDAIILASAGLIRLGLQEKISQKFTPEEMLPAIGQGILALEARENDTRVLELLTVLHDENTAKIAAAERGLNASLGGSCQVPIGAYAKFAKEEKQTIWLRALVGSPDGKEILRDEITGIANNASEAEFLGKTLAEKLTQKGAKRLLQMF